MARRRKTKLDLLLELIGLQRKRVRRKGPAPENKMLGGAPENK